MSTKGHPPNTSKLSTRSFHHRNNSQELDVFEAAKYFSGYKEAPSSYNIGATYREKPFKEEFHKHKWRGGRMSLDVPMRHLITKQDQTLLQEKQVSKEKKYKQPSSPGGRLASFLNSIFNQTSSKKKSKSTKDSEEESPGGGRRRRSSSISHFRSSSTNSNNINIISDYSKPSSSTNSNINIRTPPPRSYAHTPTKSYKQVVCFTKPVKDCALDDQIRKMESLSWMDEKAKFEDGLEEKREIFRNFNYNEGTNDGAESDSSSDLFELQNYDLGLDVYASGLPVYETTHLDGIKRGNPNF